MGGGSSTQRDRDAQRRIQQQRIQQNTAARTTGTARGGGGAVPNHLLHHQPPEFQRHMAGQNSVHTLRQLQLLMQAMSGGGMRQPAVQAVTEGRTITNEVSVNTHSLKFDKTTSTLEFEVVNNVPCEVEVHVAVRIDVYQGIAFTTPNRHKKPPVRIPLDKPNKDGVPLKFTLDEPYATIPEKERAYSMHTPKQFPVVISCLYFSDGGKNKSATPTSAHAPTPHETLALTQSKAEFNESEHREKVAARRAEHTCLALDPSLKVVRQFFELEGGTYLVEHLFGGEQEARVVDECAGGAGQTGAESGTAASGAVVQPGSGAVDMDGDDDEACVICLTEERDTAVIPCRHLCLCRACADELRKHTPKCPVCRGPIQQLLSMKPKSKR